MKKILVTGSNGFISSHLINSLQLHKYHILGISKRFNKNLKIEQIKKDIKKITYNDIKDEISCVVHLAGMTDIEYCRQNPIDCIETNVMGTQKMLEVARKKKCKFVYISTSHVYGLPKKIPIDEEHPRNPITIYSASKMGGEICCESYAKEYEMDVTIMRLFSVYGPKSPSHDLITKIISQFMHTNTIKLGNLYPRRDFVYISDVVDAIELVIEKSKGFNIFNVGTEQSYSILEIGNLLKRLTGRNLIMKSIKSNSRKYEIDNIVSCSSKIKKLGWLPRISIEEGLQTTLQYHTQRTC